MARHWTYERTWVGERGARNHPVASAKVAPRASRGEGKMQASNPSCRPTSLRLSNSAIARGFPESDRTGQAQKNGVGSLPSLTLPLKAFRKIPTSRIGP